MITCLHNLSESVILAAQLNSLWSDEDVNMPLTGGQAYIRCERHVPHFCGNAAWVNFSPEKMTKGEKLCHKTATGMAYHLIWRGMLHDATMLDNGQSMAQTQRFLPVVSDEECGDTSV